MIASPRNNSCKQSAKNSGVHMNFIAETRVNGLPECWHAIHMAVQQPDPDLALSILRDSRISMLNNNIQLCVDYKFNKYEVPVFCLAEPISYASDTLAQKNLNYEYSDQMFDIRSVRFPTQDIIIKQRASSEVRSIKDQLRVMKELGDIGIRFFYNGREMMDGKTLGNYNYIEGSIIQAMIK